MSYEISGTNTHIEKSKEGKNRDICAEATKRIGEWEGWFSENTTRAREDKEFVYRDQWTSVDRQQFTKLHKPALTFNKVYDTVRKIVGEQRKNTPSLKVRSINGKASQEALDLRSDIIRSMAYNSKADEAFQTAFSCALVGGFGAVLVTTDYESPYSFNQVPKVNKMQFPERCFWDPRCSEVDKSDGDYCGYLTPMTRESFEAAYPDCKYPDSFSHNMLMDFYWSAKDTIVVCDYYVKEYENTKLFLLDNGASVTEEEYKSYKKRYMEIMKLNPFLLGGKSMAEVVQERMTMLHKIRHYKLTESKILEETVWPSKYLPLVFQDGDSFWIDDKQFVCSFVRHVKDAQKFLNYVGSEVASQIKNTRREQWLVTPDNIAGNEQLWRLPEVQQGALIAKPDSMSGLMPQKQPPSEIPQTLLLHFQRASDDIKQILGFYDANLGAPGNEESGVAIQNRQLNGASGSTVFFDNAERACEQVGRIVLDLLPSIVDNEREISIEDKNGKSKSISVNKKMPNGEIQNSLEGDNYDIEVVVGPSFAVQKQQAMQMLISLLQIPPGPILPLVIDIIAKNMDMDSAPQLADRLRSLVPPEILAKENGQPPPPPKPDPQAQMMQMQQQLAMKDMENKTREVDIKQQKLKQEQASIMLDAMELEQKARDSAMKNDTEIRNSEINYSTEIAKMMHREHLEGMKSNARAS